MSSADDPGADPQGSGQASEVACEQMHSQLVEALILLLIEKRVLTRNDALSIVHTVAQVQRDEAVEADDLGAQTRAALRLLRRLFRSFEALPDESAARPASEGNVHQLRPPPDQPDFPED
jgi:hypothetical protein